MTAPRQPSPPAPVSRRDRARHSDGSECSSCGKQNRIGASYCRSCGQPLPAASDRSSGDGMLVRRPVWWRMIGLLTVLVAGATANTVWKVNRHVSRMELARIFAMAMTKPRIPRAERPVGDRAVRRRSPHAPPRRPRATPYNRRATPPGQHREPRERGIKLTPVPADAPPFSLDPMDWIRPPTEAPASRPDRHWPQPVRQERRASSPPPQPQAARPQDRSAPAEPPTEPLAPEAEALFQTEVSEVTRQTWTLLGLVILECVALAGLSALLDMRRARRNLIIAAGLLIVGAALTVTAGLVITHWGGFPPLTLANYLQTVLRAAGYAGVLILILLLPRSRRYGAARRMQTAAGRWPPRLVGPVGCGLLYLATAVVCMTTALLGNDLNMPAWDIIRLVVGGWGVAAVLLGLGLCAGHRRVFQMAYVFSWVGLLVTLACWGLPYAALAPPVALQILLVLVPFHLVTLGRVRAWLATSGAQGRPASSFSTPRGH